MASEAGKQVAREKAPARVHSIEVQTRARVEFKDITGQIEKIIADSGVQSGLCVAFTPHTSAALLINENADPAIQKDFDNFLRRLAPRDADYAHNDGNCDAHLKSVLVGPSKTAFIENGRLALGTWQGIFFCEFDGPRQRSVQIKIISD